MKASKKTRVSASDSLSLRLGVLFIALLLGAALAVGYLFDRGRTEALQARELDRLRQHGERTAEHIERQVNRLRADALFLAAIPPIQGIRRALEGGGWDAAGGSTLGQWRERLERIFLAFAETRQEYFQLRLIGVQDNGWELVRVERASEGFLVTPAEQLQQKGDRYYYRAAAALPAGEVSLSRIDLNREHDRIGVPHQPTLRASTPVRDADGNLFGVVVINMDMGRVFARIARLLHGSEQVFIADEQGNFLLHPDPGRAFAFEFGRAYCLGDAFPEQAGNILALPLGEGKVFPAVLDNRDIVVYATARALQPGTADWRLIFMLAEPATQVYHTVGLMRRDSLIGMSALLALAVGLVVVMVGGLTRSLRALARASTAIAGGDYRVALPTVTGAEVSSLAVAFRRMASEVARREEALAQLNRDLEARVAERTRELARQHALHELILENIDDGVVVADRAGHFLLWNRKAVQIVGAGPEAVLPEQWPSRYGVFRDEGGEPVPADELPLVRAIRGESTDNVELYLRNPANSEGRWVMLTGRPLCDTNGQVSGGVVALLDVTERKRLQRGLAEHRAKLTQVDRLALTAEIAASAAHELSQPIAAMANYAGAAVRLQRDGRLAEGQLADILGRIDRLSRESGETLDMLRALIRRRDETPAAFDVNRVVESCLQLLDERIAGNGVPVERGLGADLPPVCGDPIELEHVLTQLVTNALDAMDKTPRGERRLWLRTRHDAARGLVVVEVEDTGQGVRAELAERLFDPWVTDKHGALGIGLAIARKIVDAYGGEIRMEPGMGTGARFLVELPAVRGP